MIGLMARACAGVGLVLISTLAAAHGAGNSSTALLGRFDNWTLEEGKALPEFRDNIPDGVRAIGYSSVPGLLIELGCITRSVDPDIRTYRIDIHLGNVSTPTKFEAVFSSGSAQFKVLMLTLPDRQTYALKLRPNTFQDIFRSFAADQNVELSFVSSSGQPVSVHIRGSSKLQPFWKYCEAPTS